MRSHFLAEGRSLFHHQGAQAHRAAGRSKASARFVAFTLSTESSGLEPDSDFFGFRPGTGNQAIHRSTDPLHPWIVDLRTLGGCFALVDAPLPCPSVPSVVREASETREHKSSTTEPTDLHGRIKDPLPIHALPFRLRLNLSGIPLGRTVTLLRRYRPWREIVAKVVTVPSRPSLLTRGSQPSSGPPFALVYSRT